MGTLLQQLKDYFENTPQEVLDKEYDEIFSKYAYGVTVDEYLQELGRYFPLAFTYDNPNEVSFNIEKGILNDEYSLDCSTRLDFAA
ncbi:MAG: hypothetical protein LIP03_12880 [Bacteroidales bacterium]|nr:hypothetical protein [Bacteroidales bacterium]